MNFSEISILGTLPPLRGISAYCLELARAMTKFCSVNFISFKKIYPAYLYPGGDLRDDVTFPEITEAGLQVSQRLTWYNPFGWITEGLFARTQLLHVQWWSLPLFPIFFTISYAFKIRNKPVVFTIHNVLPHEHSAFYLSASKLLFRFGDHFIVHTETGRRQLMYFFKIPCAKISVIPHGSLDFFVRPDADRHSLKASMGYSHKNQVILIFGAIRPYKGIDVAIRAVAEVAKKFPEVRLLIAGKLWEDWEPYRQLIEKFSMGSFVSAHLEYVSTNEVYKYFEVADLCIFPYRHFESQSGAAAAAVSFRKPMIVSNVGGLPELVDNPRFIVPPDDPHSLAEAIIEYLNNKEKFHCKADSRKIPGMDWTEIARKTVAVYEDLLLKKLK